MAVAAAGLIAVAQPDEPRASDDLKKLEGIGPAIQRLLAENGVHSFAQLAAADVEDLRAYVLQGGRHMKSHDPSSWPQQAALAAEGRCDELHALREALRTRR